MRQRSTWFIVAREEGATAAQSTLQAASSTEVLLSHYSIERRWGDIGIIFCNQLKGFFFLVPDLSAVVNHLL